MKSPDFSGTKLTREDITVVRGGDPSVRADTLDPSGFGQFGTTAGDGLLEAIRDIYLTEANRAPNVLRDSALRRIPVYLNYRDSVASDATMLAGQQRMRFDAQTRSPIHFEHADPKGIGLRVDDLTITPKLIGRIEHECRHLLTRLGVHMFNVGPNESLIAGLDRWYNPDDRNAYIPWDIRRDLSLSTTGLNSPTDFGSVDYSAKAQEALYLSAHCSFEGIQVELIWKIWELLTELSLTQQRFPLQEEVRTTIFEVLQEEANAVLESPAFLPMTPGDHVVAFRTPVDMPGNRVEFRAFSAQINQDFGLQQTPYGFQYNDTVLSCSESSAPGSTIYFYDRNGQRIPNAEGGGRIQYGSYGASFEREAGYVASQFGAQGEAFLQNVGSIEIQTAGLTPVKLIREK